MHRSKFLLLLSQRKFGHGAIIPNRFLAEMHPLQFAQKILKTEAGRELPYITLKY